MNKLDAYNKIRKAKIFYLDFFRFGLLPIIFLYHIAIYTLNFKYIVNKEATSSEQIINVIVIILSLLLILFFHLYNKYIWTLSLLYCIGYNLVLGTTSFIRLINTPDLSKYQGPYIDMTGLGSFVASGWYYATSFIIVTFCVLLQISVVLFFIHYKLFFYTYQKLHQEYIKTLEE